MNLVFTIAIVLLQVVSWAVIIRALFSWFDPQGRNAFNRVLIEMTEPLLAPVRGVLMRLLPIPIDLSPIAVILLLNLLESLLRSAYRS
jgi:YggT family protein